MFNIHQWLFILSHNQGRTVYHCAPPLWLYFVITWGAISSCSCWGSKSDQGSQDLRKRHASMRKMWCFLSDSNKDPKLRIFQHGLFLWFSPIVFPHGKIFKFNFNFDTVWSNLMYSCLESVTGSDKWPRKYRYEWDRGGR